MSPHFMSPLLGNKAFSSKTAFCTDLTTPRLHRLQSSGNWDVEVGSRRGRSKPITKRGNELCDWFIMSTEKRNQLCPLTWAEGSPRCIYDSRQDWIMVLIIIIIRKYGASWVGMPFSCIQTHVSHDDWEYQCCSSVINFFFYFQHTLGD